MAKDPAFLFYDGDAARDVSHMNRLERGCYFDLMQAQRKFGGYTVEQARKILGKDFDDCWSAIELVLSLKDGVYYIEWVAESIEKRKEHAEKQRVRIQDYWDKKKTETEPINNHGNTTVLPLVNEIEIVNEKEKEHANESFILKDYCQNFFDPKYVTDKSIDMFDKLIRIDGYTPIQIQEAISNACNDLFWGKNFLSPLKLREKNKDKVYYIDVFLKIEPKKQSKHDEAGQYVASRLREAIRNS